MVIYGFDEINIDAYKGLLIDLDNTLYSYQAAHQSALEHCHKRLEEMSSISFEKFQTKLEEAKNQIKSKLKGQAASHSRLLYFQRFFEIQSGQTLSSLTLEFEDIYWKSFLEAMQANSEAINFIKRAHEKGLTIGIVTDLTAQIQHQKIIKLGIANYIHYLTSSEEAGADKPDPQIYKIAMNKMACNSNEVIMVGDDYEKDIKGAENIGIKCNKLDLI